MWICASSSAVLKAQVITKLSTYHIGVYSFVNWITLKHGRTHNLKN